MKKELFTISLILTVVCQGLFAQTNDVEQEILQQKPSKSIVISKARQLLMDKILEKDWQKVAKLKDYLLDQEDTNYIALHPSEYWYTLYHLQAYPELLMDVRHYDSIAIAYLMDKIFPTYDMLLPTLHKKTVENKSNIHQQISHSKVGEKEKTFLHLHIDWLLNTVKQDSLNIRSEDFLNTYSPTVYDNFIRKHIRQKYKVKGWGMIIGYSLGYGILDGQIGNYYTNPVLLCFDIGGLFNQFELSLNSCFGPNKNKYDIPYSEGVWASNSSTSYFLGYGSLGYTSFENDRLRLTPFIGIGGGEMNAPQKNRNENSALKEITISTGPIYFAGFRFDFKLGKKSHRQYPYSSTKNHTYYGISLKYSYGMTTFDKKHLNIKGNIHNITLGMNMIGRMTKKVTD